MGKKCCESVSTSSTSCSSVCDNAENSNKCTEVSNCCTPQYQRLQKIVNQWSLTNTAEDWDDIYEEDVYDRQGNRYDYEDWTCAMYSDSEVDDDDLSGNLMVSWAFVTSHRYCKFEKNKKDQVWGWYVNGKNGDLVFMQETEGVSTCMGRQRIYSKPCSELTLTEKKAKSVFDRFYNMSVNVINHNKYPSTEGNILEVSDSCGQKWLVAMNFADGLQGHYEEGGCNKTGVLGLGEQGRYVFVACKL